MVVLLRYRVREECLSEAAEVRRVFFAAQRAANDPAARYRAFREPDGRTFVHLAEFSGADAHKRFLATPHFQAYAEGLKRVCEDGPQTVDLELVETTDS
ncbi:MAG: antibiotic biosynthesis monooxygenase [SAR324 cluster bacterium]|nr:antibiotic biosynthesis monooxygenase [SAR324 cluster bacterium]